MIDLETLMTVTSETTTLTLATLDPDGTPRATPLFFAVDEALRLIFLSERESQHAQNLARNPQAAVGLYPEVRDWEQIRGLQLKGRVEAVPDLEADEALDCYRTRFPFIRALHEIVTRSAVFRFQPSWARLIDNRQGFGYHQEWRFQDRPRGGLDDR